APQLRRRPRADAGAAQHARHAGAHPGAHHAEPRRVGAAHSAGPGRPRLGGRRPRAAGGHRLSAAALQRGCPAVGAHADRRRSGLMPILPPALDDRSFADLVDDLVRRIPVHTPEWTNPLEGDPGRTLIDLFAWLADTILYRANLVPERQRLAFLRLLGAPMRPAQPASGLIALTIDDKNATDAVHIDRFARIDQPVP